MQDSSQDNSASKKLIQVRVDYHEQISDLLGAVAGEAIIVVPQGAGTRELMPAGEDKNPLVLLLGKLDRIVGLSTSDFLVKCQAGARLSELFGKLDSSGLTFPFLTGSVVGTVGGMVACGQLKNETGCYAVSRWVLAVRVILADGTEAVAGAATFKSVAGYDLPRLFCGSFGTLGVITEVTLRCYPRGSRPYGKDLDPVPAKAPFLAVTYSDLEPGSNAVRIARKIKHSLDPLGIFPVIDGWNLNPGPV